MSTGTPGSSSCRVLRAAVLPASSIGFGLGRARRHRAGSGGEPISYQLFVAPALLATASMNGAITETTFNFFFKLNYNKTFTSILATPMSPGDVAAGELSWALIRGGLYALGFVGVMLLLGLFVSPWVDPRPSRRRCSSGSPSVPSGWPRRRS